MAPALHAKQLALDTNILLDLADEVDVAHDFRETFQRAGYILRIPPTVVSELLFESDQGEDAQLALKALQSMRSWSISPYDLVSVGHGITDRFSDKLLRKGMLPDGEYNDGLILAEASLGRIPILVTSDKHLLNIDDTLLKLAFDECDLFHVHPSHPKLLTRAMR
jgi:predicted nucleic acid-binding protein